MEQDEQSPVEITESSETPDTDSKAPFVLAGIAVLGVLLGGAGLYFGLTANQALEGLRQDFTAELAGQPDYSGKIGELTELLESLESRLQNVGEATAQADRQVRALTDDTKRAFRDVDRSLTEVRRHTDINTSELEQIVDAINKLQAAVASGARAPSSSGSRSGSAAPSDSTASGQTSGINPELTVTGPGGGTVHSIESGDTFDRLAREYGVSVRAILEANPSVDPRRLQIGQQILIPDPR